MRYITIEEVIRINWNGYDLRAEQMDLLDVTLDVVEHRIDLDKLAEWIELHSGPIDFSAIEDIDLG